MKIILYRAAQGGYNYFPLMLPYPSAQDESCSGTGNMI